MIEERRETPYSNLGDLRRLEELVHDLVATGRAQNEQIKTLTERVVALEVQVLKADTARRLLLWFLAILAGLATALFDVWDRIQH